MDWLNYHHFLYFWMVVREGGVAPAAKKLRLTHPTVSAQIRQLEDSLGEKLFDRSARRLELTEVGHLAYEYAESIFPAGQEFVDIVRQRAWSRPLRLVVGATGAIPKTVVCKLLAPAFLLETPVRIVVRENVHDRLIAELAQHEVDVVLSDVPLSPTANVRAYNHVLGESGVSFFASPNIARALRGPFPEALDSLPFISPLESSSLGRAIQQWFDEHGVHPRVVAEIQDSALIKAMAQEDLGFFCLPTVIEKDAAKTYGVEVLGRTSDIVERFYAISPERRLRHPAVVAISETARAQLFARSATDAR